MAAGECEQQNVYRQDEKQHRERREIAFALAMEHLDDHRTRAAEQVLEGKPETAVLARESGNEVLEDEAHRVATSVGALSAFGAELSLEFGAAVEAGRGLDFGLGFLYFGLRLGLYLVLHDCRC